MTKAESLNTYFRDAACIFPKAPNTHCLTKSASSFMAFEDICPAFRAYQNFKRIPKNAPPFDFASNGYPVVQPGERYCRYATGSAGVLCGHVDRKTDGLHRHISSFHKVDSTLRPVAKKGTRNDAGFIEDAEFFRGIMEDEDYDATELTGKQVQERVRQRRALAKAKSGANKKKSETGGSAFDGSCVTNEEGIELPGADDVYEVTREHEDVRTPDAKAIIDEDEETELKEHVREKGLEDEAEGGLDAAARFLQSFEGYTGAMAYPQAPQEKVDLVCSGLDDSDDVDAPVLVPDMKRVYTSPYFPKMVVLQPEPSMESERELAEPVEEDHHGDEQGDFGEGDEVVELERARSECALDLAMLKRKEAEVQLSLYEIDEKLAEARKKFRRE